MAVCVVVDSGRFRASAYEGQHVTGPTEACHWNTV